MEKIFAAMDPGHDEIFAVAASWSKSGKAVLEGFFRVRNSGMYGENGFGPYPTTDHIRAAISGLSRKTGRSVHEVFFGISSSSVNVFQSSGSVLLSRYGREISERDIKRCVEIGSMARIPIDREILHTAVRGFSVDGEGLIRDPLGLEAVKLGVDVNIATINATCVRNLSRAISQAGYIPAGFVFSPLASSMRILSEDDRADHTAFISILGRKIEVLIFYSGTLENCRVFDRVLTFSEKDMPDNTQAESYERFFREVLSMRGWPEVRRVVISGTRSPSEEFLHSAEKFFSLPIRAGYPASRSFEDLPEDGASYATALGIIDHLEQQNNKNAAEKNTIKRAFNRIVSVLDEYF